MTNTSQSAAYFFESASSSLPSPTFMRQFSSSTSWPGLTSTPSIQSRISGTSRPSSSPMRLATGASESSSLHCPSFGRPRCEVTMTAAPFSSASRSVGSAARMRVSDVMRPSVSIGTFRSSRISTRRPARSRSLMRTNGHRNRSGRRIMNARAIARPSAVRAAATRGCHRSTRRSRSDAEMAQRFGDAGAIMTAPGCRHPGRRDGMNSPDRHGMHRIVEGTPIMTAALGGPTCWPP